MAVLEQVIEHHLGMSFAALKDVDFFDEVDADILTNLLQELDETFFDDVKDDARWERVYAGTGQDLWSALMAAWDRETVVGVSDDLKWMASEERSLRAIGQWHE
jgi:hypothetical protein